MPVTYTPRPDGKTWVNVEKASKENQFTGKERKGFNSRSGTAVLTDPILALAEQPTVDKPAALIKHLRIIGAKGEGDKIEDVLTAQGHALYEMLMACARDQGIEKHEFLVAEQDAMKYLRIEHKARLQSLLDQLWRTEVEYDFRVPGYSRNGTMSLLFPDWINDEGTGKRFIAFSIHNAIKRIILERHHYTKLEITAFPKFSCKYTPRLYPRLALIAGQDEPYRSWQVEPEVLARDLGFQFSGAFHFGTFEKVVLKKVHADIELHITRFASTYEVVRKPGRGNPVAHILFTVAPRETILQEQRKVPLTADQYSELNASLKNEDTFYGEMPSAELLRQGATMTGFDVLELLELWKSSLGQMHAYPSMELPDADMVTGDELFGLLDEQGIGAAFAHWCSFLKKKPVEVAQVQLADSGVVTYTNSETGYRIIDYGNIDPFKKAFEHQELVDELTADRAAAVDHCDPGHKAWRFFTMKLVDHEENALVAAMRIAALPQIPHASRIDFITRLLKKVSAAKSYDVGEVVYETCRKDEKRMRVELDS